MLSCLDRAEECLTGLGSAAAALDRPRRKAGLLRARLELGEVEEAMASAAVPTLVDLAVELAELAGDVQAGIVPPLAMATVRSQYIRPGQAGEGVGP